MFSMNIIKADERTSVSSNVSETEALAHLKVRVRLREKCFNQESCAELSSNIVIGSLFSAKINSLLIDVFHEEAPLYIANDVYSALVDFFEKSTAEEVQCQVQNIVNNLGSSGIKVLAVSKIGDYTGKGAGS